MTSSPPELWGVHGGVLPAWAGMYRWWGVGGEYYSALVVKR
jgi:hypothetical protein